MHLDFLCMHINFSIFPRIESKGNFFSSSSVGHACTLKAHQFIQQVPTNKVLSKQTPAGY